jgi:hypothetical protein
MVPALTPKSRARSPTWGITVLGFHSPEEMRTARASRTWRYRGRVENRLGTTV